MTHSTVLAAERIAPSSSPLQPLPDQRSAWRSPSQPLTFDTAAHLVLDAHLEDGERSDIVANQIRSWAFGSDDGSTMALAPLPLPGRDRLGTYPIRDLAFSQLCQRIGAPSSYLKALPAKLQMANLNWGLARQESQALLRLAGNEVRAIVSERYAALDDELVLNMVADCLDRSGYGDDAMVRAISTGPHTVLRVTLPGEGRAVKVGDVIEHGIDIANSELGLRSVQVTPVTYRLVCSNGMRSWKSEATMRMRHVGDPDRLADQLRDAIPVAFAEARGDLDRWARAMDTLIDDALDEVESLRGFGLTKADVRAVAGEIVSEVPALPEDSFAESVEQALQGQPTTAFDVANAITSTARSKSTEARLAIEEAGHRYLVRRTA
ncbi:MAG: DUF932 domain-containing protein [Deltaproteobacteria bacterium]|nr:DUF932 domain-containing protein [Deltaproteobacteria bacterium]